MYKVIQIQQDDSGAIQRRTVGSWDKVTGRLSIGNSLRWFHDQLAGSETGTPESVCSKPCGPGLFQVNLDLQCCWECRQCRENEVVVRNGTACTQCEPLSWPNQQTFLTCDAVPPTFLHWADPPALACLALAILGLALSLLMVALFTKYRHERLIKATSRELSMLTLSGVLLSYVAALVMLSEPNPAVCYTGRIAFNLSFAIAYAPLVAKVTRIHRIFAAAKHGTKAPSFVSTQSQLALCAFLISIQASVV